MRLGPTLPTHLQAWIKARLQLIAGIWWRSEREHFKANMRLNEILEHLTDELASTETTHYHDTPSWLVAIERAASTRIQTIHTVEDLAAIAGMSVAHFSRQFRQSTGQPPAKWLRQRRMDIAADLLRATDEFHAADRRSDRHFA